MRLGNTDFNCPLILAPMAGVTDLPFRQICLAQGADFAVSEMVSSNPRLWENDKSTQRLMFDEGDNPYSTLKVVQIAGSDPHEMAMAAQHCITQGAQVIDINMGCPAKKVNKKMAGSALLQYPDKIEAILKAVVAAVSAPVTMKMRTGWDKANNNALHIAQIAEQCGIKALTIHGRSRSCLFQGDAEYETIRQVKNVVTIPVVANGDIDSPEKAMQVLQYTGADGLMIGRGAQGNPWLFGQIRCYLNSGRYPLPTPQQLQQTVLQHVCHLHLFYGPYKGLRIARKHVRWYLSDDKMHGDFCCLFNGIERDIEQLDALRRYFQL